MKKPTVCICLIAVGLALAASTVSAQPSSHGEPPSEGEADPPQAIPGLTISGFVDASYFTHDLSGVGNSFGLDQVEIDISKELQGRGTIRADLEWVNDGEGGFALDVEQGYVTFDLTDGGPVTLTFGKFNAPIGFELLDAPDMYQFSHALVFDYGLPTNFTGAMLSAQLPNGVDVSLYVSNGWDQNADLNSGKNVGGRIGFPVGNVASIGVSGTVDSGGDAGDLKVLDVDVTVNASEVLTLGGEFNRGISTIADARYEWFGFLVMGHYDFTDQYGLTLRYDYFDDQDGSRLGSGEQEVRTAFAVAPTMALGGGMGVLLEIRRERSSSRSGWRVTSLQQR